MIEYLLKRRKITLLFFAMITITGLLSFMQLPRQTWPDVIITYAIVTTTYPGATAEKVEQTVTKKIEQRIKELQGIKNITSYSGNGYSSIIVEAQSGVDPAEKWDELRKKVTEAEADLPEDANQPTINDDLNRSAVYAFNVTADTVEQLYDMRDMLTNWRDQLRTVPGVAEVTIGGLPEQEVRVDVDTQKLNHYGIGWGQVMAALRAENNKVPMGDLEVDGRVYQLKLPDTYEADKLNQVIVSRTAEGFPVYIKDVGRAYLTTEKVKTLVYHNGKPAVVVGISVEKGTDVPSVQARIDDMMERLMESRPSWSAVEPVYLQLDEIDGVFKILKKEMVIAIAAVLFVCALGLNFITALMVAVAIPISMALGLLLLPALNITINNISVYAMIIVLGILVDDAVVVNDNIERRLSVMKDPPFAAAVNGAREVSISILTATMATVFSFGPLLFLSGNTGEFIKPVPVVVSLTMLASMAMSLTIVPIFRNWYESRNRPGPDQGEKPAGLLGRQITRLTKWYAHTLLPRVLKRPVRVGLAGMLIGTLAYGLVPFTPVELFPTADRDELTLLIKMPKGVDVKETDAVTREVQNWVMGQSGVKMTAASAGGRAYLWFGAGTAMDETADENAMVMAKIDTKQLDLEKTGDKWRDELSEMYPGVDINPFYIITGPPVGEAITVHLYGDDIGELRKLSQQVKDRISKVPGARNIQDNFGFDRYALEFDINRAMMDQRLVNYNDLTATLRLVTEGITVGEYDNGRELIDMKLYAQKPEKEPMAVLQQITIPNARGEQVALSELAAVKPSFSLQSIPHRNLSRSVTITGDVHSRTTTEVMTDVIRILNEMEMPDGYRWETGGEMTEQTDTFIDMGKLSIIVIFLIIIVVAMQFYSLSLPLLVMSTVYLAAAGSVIGLFITRTPLGFMSMMGVIALAGIVVRNGIVLIEFIERSRREGVELKEAVIKAGEARLRPILLTSTTAIAGLMPLALTGDRLFTPLATTIISGLVFSTLLTLVVVPSLYAALAGWKDRRRAGRVQKTPELDAGDNISG